VEQPEQASVREQDAPIVNLKRLTDVRACVSAGSDRWTMSFDIGSVINEAKAREAILSAPEETLPDIPEAMAAVRNAICSE
jgi:hypothetical protein